MGWTDELDDDKQEPQAAKPAEAQAPPPAAAPSPASVAEGAGAKQDVSAMDSEAEENRRRLEIKKSGTKTT